MRIAFKEWAVVVDALGRGEQIIILRKGGIKEGAGGFRVEYPRFFLFPTLFHQQRESVLPGPQARFDLIAPDLAKAEVVRIEYFGEVASWRRIESLEVAERLRGQHIWRDEVIAERFDWGKSQGIFGLAVRVFRLGHAVELPMVEEYGGCKSWVELANDLELEGAQPVLSEEGFGVKVRQFEGALG